MPRNVLSVEIVNKTNNTIFAKEQISESGIATTLFVKHTFDPYVSHIIEILDGDAKNTMITQTFENIDSKTKILTHVEFNLQCILVPFSFIPQSNLEYAANTMIENFILYEFQNMMNLKKL